MYSNTACVLFHSFTDIDLFLGLLLLGGRFFRIPVACFRAGPTQLGGIFVRVSSTHLLLWDYKP